ncbi:MAG: hypothetical protein CUN55_11190 [Phototrophicales bacterium]|nr:MAG: hypothetical protein CUN55_11190 [Phototrophicales bacterium]
MRLRFVILCLLGLFFINTSILHAQDEAVLTATTNDVANFRAGPELTYSIITTLDAGTTVLVDGRRSDNLWLRVNYNGQQGWIFAGLLDVQGNIESLPIVESATIGATTNTSANPEARDATRVVANFRTGPSTAYSIIATLPANTPLVLMGRNAESTWVQVSVDGQTGWIFASLITTLQPIRELPIQEAPPLTVNNVSVPASVGNSAPTGIISGIGARATQIFRAGQTLGNRADVFSKVGDSISTNPLFLYPVGVGGLVLDAYAYLQPTVEYFSKTPARTHNSFANESLAVRSGWTSGDVLAVGNGASGICLADESPLVCEYRVTKPAVALIMLGTNDVLRGIDSATYRANMQAIITTSINMGVIPVISTLPDNLNGQGQRVLEFNAILRSLAVANGIPLWDYWAALQGLPSSGISSDGYHPSFDPATGQTGVFTPQYMQYGYNVRNYTALVVLDTLRRQVLER